jgi:hypothetical protein
MGGSEAEMKDTLMQILKDLLDDHNIALYILCILALTTPALRELIAGGILGYWTKSTKEKQNV